MVMLSPNTTTPGWVEKGSVDRFIKIRGKLTEIKQAKAEIDRFVEEEIPEDNQLVAAHKQASKKADRLQADLQSACNDLAAMTIEEDECFGDKFFGSLETFIEVTRKNVEAQDKVVLLKNLLSSRGIVTHQTNIDAEQVKSQLPLFNGTSSLSIVDASDTCVKILKNSGFHRQVWGNSPTLILGKSKNQFCHEIFWLCL